MNTHFVLAFDFFLKNINLTYLLFFGQAGIRKMFQQNIKVPEVGIEPTTPTIYGLEF